MSFEDIDTPASEDELFGEAEEQPVAEQEVVSEESPAVETPQKKVHEAAESEVKTEADPAQERSPVIPRARFDELNAKLHSTRSELEELRAQLAAKESPPVAVDVGELEKEYFDAILQGDQEKAVGVRAKINAEISSQAEKRAEERVMNEITERESKTATQRVVSDAIAAYPFLDHESPSANHQAIADVVEWRDFYMNKGDALPVALRKATEKVAPLYAVEPAVAEQPAKQDARKAAALARNMADSSAQAPAQAAGVGNRAAPIKPKIESQQDWEKLPDSEREALLK